MTRRTNSSETTNPFKVQVETDGVQRSFLRVTPPFAPHSGLLDLIAEKTATEITPVVSNADATILLIEPGIDTRGNRQPFTPAIQEGAVSVLVNYLGGLVSEQLFEQNY